MSKEPASPFELAVAQLQSAKAALYSVQIAVETAEELLAVVALSSGEEDDEEQEQQEVDPDNDIRKAALAMEGKAPVTTRPHEIETMGAYRED